MTTATHRKGDWMQTYRGRVFYPLDPDVEQIDIVDIAHALSQQCRFAGHCRRFYSVAEHCCHVSDRCGLDNRLWGLLHDASEAYLSDVIRPIKPFLFNYNAIEHQLMEAIAERFGLAWPLPQEVNIIDNRILMNECEQLMGGPVQPWDFGVLEKLPGLTVWSWSPDKARFEFLKRYRELTGEAV